MTEKPLTKKITQIIKDADKLVQDVQKGVARIGAGIKVLKEMGKSEGEQDKR